MDTTLPAGAASPARRAHHFPELDSLRGLAALVVVFGHFARLWDSADLSGHARFLLNQVFLPFLNGRSSVTLFFLLSGFVLTLPYKRRTELPYPTFLLRRLARIYVPYLAALLLALLGDWYFHHPIAVAPDISLWFRQTWTAPLTPALIAQHLLLIGNYNTAQVNTAFWSLAVEMRLSLLFPLLCLPLLRGSRLSARLLLGALILLDAVVPHLLIHHLTPVSFQNLTDMTLGLVAFAAGILLARALEPVHRLWKRTSTPTHLLFGALSVIFLEWTNNLSQTHLYAAENLLTIAGGTGILVLALCSHRVSLVLNHRLPAWLGRISYSLYLVHATVLFTLVNLLFGRLTRLQLLLPYLVASLTLAALFFFAIEQPSIRLSRSIGRRGRSLANSPPNPVS